MELTKRAESAGVKGMAEEFRLGTADNEARLVVVKVFHLDKMCVVVNPRFRRLAENKESVLNGNTQSSGVTGACRHTSEGNGITSGTVTSWRPHLRPTV